MSKVSVVVPTRGRPDLVCRAVRSALTQTMSDVEVMVVVDGPDHASVLALQELNDPRVNIIALEESVGGSEARNIGVRAASSEWLALLDDDDEWHANKLERQLSYAAPSGLQLLVTQFCLHMGEGECEDLVWPSRFPRANEPISEYLFCTNRNVFQTSTILCSRELLLKVPFTKGLRRLQDWDWLLRAVALPEVQLVAVPEALSIYNVAGPGATISKAHDWEGSFMWGKDNRQYMTARGYRGFIAKKCAADAARQKVSKSIVWMLFKESFRGSGLKLREPAMFLLYYYLPPSRRHLIADRIQIWRSKLLHGARGAVQVRG